MNRNKSFAIYAGIQLVGQLFAWFIAASFGYDFGTEGYGRVAALTLFLTAVFGALPVMDT